MTLIKELGSLTYEESPQASEELPTRKEFGEGVLWAAREVTSSKAIQEVIKTGPGPTNRNVPGLFANLCGQFTTSGLS